jgi:hypothetical protein
VSSHGESQEDSSRADANGAPDLRESLRQFGAAGRSTASAANDALKALRILVSADISLARSALGRALAFTGVAIAFGGSAWLLLMAALIAWLSLGLHWPWSLSLLLSAALSIAITAFAGWRAMHYFEHTRLQATRRQLARLGIGELADFMPDPGSGTSGKEAAERLADAEKLPKKGLGVDVTPP